MRSYRGSVVQWQNSQARQSRDPICGDLILAILLVLTATSPILCHVLAFRYLIFSTTVIKHHQQTYTEFNRILLPVMANKLHHNTYRSCSLLDGFLGIFYLKQMTIRWEYRDSSIVRRTHRPKLCTVTTKTTLYTQLSLTLAV